MRRESETEVTEYTLCGPAAVVKLKSGGREREKEARE